MSGKNDLTVLKRGQLSLATVQQEGNVIAWNSDIETTVLVETPEGKKQLCVAIFKVGEGGGGADVDVDNVTIGQNLDGVIFVKDGGISYPKLDPQLIANSVQNNSYKLPVSSAVYGELINVNANILQINSAGRLNIVFKNRNGDVLFNKELNIDTTATQNSKQLINSHAVWKELFNAVLSYFKIDSNKLKLRLMKNDGTTIMDAEVPIDQTATQNSSNLIDSNAVWKELLDNLTSVFVWDQQPTSDRLKLMLYNNDGQIKVNRIVDFGDKLVLEKKTQTLEHKTIDADDNTIQDIDYLNFRNGFMLDQFQALPDNRHIATEKLVFDSIRNANRGFVFKGYISLTAPTGELTQGDLWYEGDIMATTFPCQVHEYDGTAWSVTTQDYNPHNMDLWRNLEQNTGAYWFGNSWNLLDTSADVDNVTIEKNLDGELEVKDEGITFDKLNTNLYTDTITTDTDTIPLNNAVYKELVDILNSYLRVQDHQLQLNVINNAGDPILEANLDIDETATEDSENLIESHAVWKETLDNDESTLEFDDTDPDSDVLKLELQNKAANIVIQKELDFSDKLVFEDKTQELNNKTIDADNNTLSNLVTDNFKEDVVVTDLSAHYYYHFVNAASQVGYYTQSTTGSNIDVFTITFDGGNVTEIAKEAFSGNIQADGSLDINGVIYARHDIGDGYYIVDDEKKLLAASTVNEFLQHGGGGGNVDDVTLDSNSLLQNKVAEMQSPTTAEIAALFDGMPTIPRAFLDIIYPVGSIIINNGTDPGTYLTGSTWTRYATDTKVVYAANTAGTTVNEELPNPSITLASNGKKTVDFKGIKGFGYQAGGKDNVWGIDYGHHELYEQASFANTETASNHSHTVTIGSSVYKTNGKVRATGITACYWIRTA